ncbi:MAG: lipocalin family protein [Planctomycetota bacterium]
MTKRTLMWMMMALIAVMPASLAAADDALTGRWALESVTVQGQTEEAPEGELVFEFGADNTVTMYQQGQEMESGTYEVQGNQLVMTSASDGETETVGFAVDGDTLTLKMEIQPGLEMSMAFSREGSGNHAAPIDFVALDGSDLHGRWDMQSVEFGGQKEEVPAGAFSIEFLADGTCKMYEEGVESDSGTYSVSGDQLTVTTENDGEAPVGTYSIEGDTLSVEMTDEGMTYKMTLTRAN